jgi:hypothetical protein
MVTWNVDKPRCLDRRSAKSDIANEAIKAAKLG